MDCTIKLNISYVLKKIIERLIEDVNSWYDLMSSEEFILLNELERNLNERNLCKKQCVGCLDYHLVSHIFFEFIDGISELNESHEELLCHISKTLSLRDLNNPVNLAVDLISSPMYVEKQLDESKIGEYREYYKGVKGVFTSLALQYCNQKKVELHDVIMMNAKLSEEQEVSYKTVNMDEGDVVFYIDQNFISKYINDSNLSIQVENIKRNANYKFVFSPYLIEDGIKMNRVFLKDYFENIVKLTDGVLVSRHNNKLCYLTEEIHSLVNRVMLWLEPTRAAENLKVFNAIYNQYAYPVFNRNKEIVKKLNDNIGLFFKELNYERTLGVTDFNNEIGLLLNAILINKSYPFTIQDLNAGSIGFDDDYDCMNKIDCLCELLDFINYQTESSKNKNKIKSSYQDAEHLKHGWKSDYFITDDERLINRGELIYSMLGLKTRFIKISDFKKMMVNFYKK